MCKEAEKNVTQLGEQLVNTTDPEMTGSRISRQGLLKSYYKKGFKKDFKKHNEQRKRKYKNNPNVLLKVKNKLSEFLSSLHGFNSSLDTIEENIREFGDGTIETKP